MSCSKPEMKLQITSGLLVARDVTDRPPVNSPRAPVPNSPSQRTVCRPPLARQTRNFTTRSSTELFAKECHYCRYYSSLPYGGIPKKRTATTSPIPHSIRLFVSFLLHLVHRRKLVFSFFFYTAEIKYTKERVDPFGRGRGEGF